jgi:hypothetical protein
MQNTIPHDGLGLGFNPKIAFQEYDFYEEVVDSKEILYNNGVHDLGHGPKPVRCAPVCGSW